jgi:hypothetical protein
VKPIQLAYCSYAREDAEFVLRLAKDLRARGAEVWIDQLDIAPGQRWDRAIEDALAKCPQLLAILSPAAVESTNVMDEVSFALEDGKSIVPVLHRDCKIPFRLRGLQYVDLSLNYSAGLDRLIETLKAGRNLSIQLEVVHGDALEYPADVLALKFAQELHGVDRKVVDRLEEGGVRVKSRLPAIGSALLVNSERAIAASEVLFMGVVPLGKFNYQAIREFAHAVFATLKDERPSIQHLAMTLHGVGFGLDEAEAFRAQIAGVLDAVEMHRQPPELIRVSIVERDEQAAKRLATVLNLILPAGVISDDQIQGEIEPPSLAEARVPSLAQARVALATVGRDSHQKPHVFVAMPFADEYADRFQYGIQGAANAAGYLCERADLASFTGDVIAWVKDRIDSAALVIADLSTANPNVYLEVGYAWGRGVRTVLIVAQGDEVKFDVRTQRYLAFRSIRQLEELLTKELKALTAELRV